MSLPGQVGDAERQRQRRTAAALVDLLAAAIQADLPALTWSVTVTSELVGRCTAMDMPTRRREFEAWARFLAPVRRWPEHAHGGVSHLRATHTDHPPGIDVVVVADIYHQPVDGLVEVDR